jgi:VIT1/CCC1 family predicted Fe2+/Mn2+ transporter
MSKTLKSILFVAYLVAMLTLAIGGTGWSDYADSKFWQTAWNVLCGVGVAGFIGGVFWYVTGKQQN